MHVTAEQDGEVTRQGGEWIVTTRITVRMTDTERWQMDGLRYEAFGWTRFRLKLSRQPPGAGPGGSRYEVATPCGAVTTPENPPSCAPAPGPPGTRHSKTARSRSSAPSGQHWAGCEP